MGTGIVRRRQTLRMWLVLAHHSNSTGHFRAGAGAILADNLALAGEGALAEHARGDHRDDVQRNPDKAAECGEAEQARVGRDDLVVGDELGWARGFRMKPSACTFKQLAGIHVVDVQKY